MTTPIPAGHVRVQFGTPVAKVWFDDTHATHYDVPLPAASPDGTYDIPLPCWSGPFGALPGGRGWDNADASWPIHVYLTFGPEVTP